MKINRHVVITRIVNVNITCDKPIELHILSVSWHFPGNIKLHCYQLPLLGGGVHATDKTIKWIVLSNSCLHFTMIVTDGMHLWAGNSRKVQGACLDMVLSSTSTPLPPLSPTSVPPFPQLPSLPPCAFSPHLLSSSNRQNFGRPHLHAAHTHAHAYSSSLDQQLRWELLRYWDLLLFAFRGFDENHHGSEAERPVLQPSVEIGVGVWGWLWTQTALQIVTFTRSGCCGCFSTFGISNIRSPLVRSWCGIARLVQVSSLFSFSISVHLD